MFGGACQFFDGSQRTISNRCMKDKTSRLTVINLNLTNREMHGNAALLVERKPDADFASAVDDGVI